MLAAAFWTIRAEARIAKFPRDANPRLGRCLPFWPSEAGLKNKPPFLSPPEAARRANVSDRALRDWCERIPGLAVRVVGRWRVNPAALDRVLRGELRPDGGEHARRIA